MTRDEITRILFGHLENNTLDQALNLSQKEIGRTIIGQFSGMIRDDFVSILQKVAEANVDALPFLSLAEETGISQVGFPTESIMQLIGIYQKFSEIFGFIYKNREIIDFGPHNDLAGEVLREWAKLFEQKHKAYSEDFERNRKFRLNTGEIGTFKTSLDLAYFLLLNSEMFDRFRNEFNGAVSVLMELVAELDLMSGDDAGKVLN